LNERPAFEAKAVAGIVFAEAPLVESLPAAFSHAGSESIPVRRMRADAGGWRSFIKDG
jgi:hypothetical protein